MKPIEIRDATPGDYFAIRSLLAAERLPLDGVAPDSPARFFVAVNSQEIVGCVAFETYASDGLLRSLAVDATVRGAGLGRRLARRIEHEAANVGIQNFYVLTTTAAAYFKKRGHLPRVRGLP
jgi:amino-acid N-acetyltransferase